MITYKKSHPNWVPYGIFGVLCFVALLQIVGIARVSNFISKDRYAFIQKPDGSTATAEAVDPLKRTPETVKKFIRQWKHLAWTWVGKTPDGKDEPKINFVGQFIPAPLYKASYGIVAPYRQDYLIKQIAIYKGKGFPIDGFANKKMTARIENTMEISNLRETSLGNWEADVASTRTIMQSQKPDLYEIRREKFYLVATPPYFNSWEPPDSPYYQYIKEMQDQGLMIKQID